MKGKVSAPIDDKIKSTSQVVKCGPEIVVVIYFEIRFAVKIN